MQCQINAWYCEQAPWKLLDCEDDVRRLLKLREQLIPRLCAAFERYHDTGIPPVRALVMDYTADPNVRNIDDEYLFCDDLLVAPLTAQQESRKVYIPDGAWCDFWTGQSVDCGFTEASHEWIAVYRRV